MSAAHLPSLVAARPVLRELWAGGGSIGSIHTLGALHAGHATVIELAAIENEHVIVTVYPNRAQLAPRTRYEFDLERDVALAAEHGATHIISSVDSEMYPDAYRTLLDQQPAHQRLDATAISYVFPGMITMSVRWILFVRPHRTYWGLKDIGQLVLVRRALDDLLVDTTVREVPCVRFRSGVPISSRLLRLERRSLTEVRQVYVALEAGRRLAAAGGVTAADVIARVRATLDELPLREFQVCYVKLVDPTDFAELGAARPPMILHVAITNEEIFHFDGLFIRTEDELRDGAPVLWLDEEWPCAA